jgi:hypothetical protein
MLLATLRKSQLQIAHHDDNEHDKDAFDCIDSRAACCPLVVFIVTCDKGFWRFASLKLLQR